MIRLRDSPTWLVNKIRLRIISNFRMSTASKVTLGLSAVFCGTAMLYNYYEDNKQKDR